MYPPARLLPGIFRNVGFRPKADIDVGDPREPHLEGAWDYCAGRGARFGTLERLVLRLRALGLFRSTLSRLLTFLRQMKVDAEPHQ